MIRVDDIEKNKIFFAVFTVLIIFHVLLMWHVRIYPFVDLPNHLAKAAIYRHMGEPSNQFDSYYAIDLFPKPNVFHLLFTGSRLFSSVEYANRLLISLYVVLLPLAILLIIKKLNGNLWFALLSFLCMYNLSLGWGFIDYAISIPFLLLWFYFLLEYDDDRSIRNGCILSVLFLLLFFMHVITSFFSLMIFFVYWISRVRRPFWTSAKELLICLPIAAMILAWWNMDSGDGQGTMHFLLDYYSHDYFQTIIVRCKNLLTFDNTFLLDGLVGNMISTAFSAFIVLFGLIALLLNRKQSMTIFKESRLLFILLLSAFLCFFVLPPGVPGNGALYERFSVFALLSTIILISRIYSERFNRTLIVLVSLPCILYSWLWTDYFLEFQQKNESFTPEFLSHTGNGKLVGLIYDHQYRGQPVYIHFPNYNIVWNSEVTATNIIDYQFGSVRRKADYESLPRYDEWISLRENKWWDDYAIFDYLLVRGSLPDNVLPLIREYRLINREEEWCIYAKKKDM